MTFIDKAVKSPNVFQDGSSELVLARHPGRTQPL